MIILCGLRCGIILYFHADWSDIRNGVSGAIHSGAPTAISVPAIIGSVVFSMLIGLIFGLLPSVKAANLNPIDAVTNLHGHK